MMDATETKGRGGHEALANSRVTAQTLRTARGDVWVEYEHNGRVYGSAAELEAAPRGEARWD